MTNINYYNSSVIQFSRCVYKCLFCDFGNTFYENGTVENWTTCSGCSNLFHDTCMKIQTKGKACYGDVWFCKLCSSDFLVSNDIPLPQENFIGEFPEVDKYRDIGTFSFEYVIKNKSDCIPLINEYKKEKLFYLFKCLGLETEAKKILDQDIDGASFLLLTRDEIFKSFGFKVGSALKVYNHLQILRWKMLS